MKLHSIAVAVVILLTVAPAQAQTAPECVVGPGLGATLLYPYFEVDLNNASGTTAVLSINNGLGDSALARVVLWTDWGVPTMAFDVFLLGFDVVTINVRDLFNGMVPSTGAGEDLSNFGGCDANPPTYSSPIGSADQRTQLRADHRGLQGPLFNDCIGSQTGDGIARGYITVDVVDGCSGAEAVNADTSPENAAYFTTLADNTNRLWGDLIHIDVANAAAQGSEAISIWADSVMFSRPDTFTFYGRFVNYDGSDQRVPLGYRWDQRFLNGGPFAGGADLIVFRDPGEAVQPATCGTVPSPFPLPNTIIAFDEDAGNLVDLSATDVVGLATQRTAIADFSIPYAFGWLQIDTFPNGAWVQPSLTASGLYSAGFNGTPVESLCSRTPPQPSLQAAEAEPVKRSQSRTPRR